MITPSVQSSLTNARRYFREHLRVGDYYTEGEAIEGIWCGGAAEKLGLKGPVGEKEFLALCDGINPQTGGTLTLRHNSTRTGEGAKKPNRRVFFDFVYCPPKSVSILGLMVDDRIVGLHRKAVQASFTALELYAGTRVRKEGACTDRRTGNLVAALFEHDTSREQDPLLHTHAVIFNATWDPVEGAWKALQTREMFRALAYADAVYNTEMTRELAKLGYGIERVGKAWEIAGVSRAMIERFSKRRSHIEARLAEELKKPSNSGIDPHVLRERIARDERKRKIRGAGRKQLLASWRAELGPNGLVVLEKLHAASLASRSRLPKADYAGALEWAKLFVFERKSVVRLHQLLAAASRWLFGTDASMDRLAEESRNAGIVVASDGDRITSVDGLSREWSIVEDARRMRGQYRPLAKNFDLSATELDGEQQRAVAHLLHSRDGVTLFRGAAGTGKTYALHEFVSRLEAVGHPVRIAAPQAQQARSLTAAGLPAETLSMLLHKDELPIGAVVIVDEAGQVGGRQMESLFSLIRRHAGRLVLSGDTRQHSSVEASDAMRSLEAYSRVRIAQIKHIRRQDPSRGRTAGERLQIAEYRRAVEEASEGQPEAALARLYSAGFVHDTQGGDVVGPTASEYERLSAERLSVLAVSQTRESVRRLNEAITQKLVARGDVREPRPLDCLVPRDVPAAEKRLSETYTPGTVLHLHRSYSSLERGELVTVDGLDNAALTLMTASGLKRRIPLKYSDYWEILERHTITAGPGSILQLRANGISQDGRKFFNGELVTLDAIGSDGTLRVRDSHNVEKHLWPDQRILQSGYAVTSYGSQGKSVDAVLLADAGVDTATHRKEWYVSISRARRRIAVFTPSITDLASRIAASGDRMLGLELLPEVREFVGIGLQATVQQAVTRARHAMHELKARIS